VSVLDDDTRRRNGRAGSSPLKRFGMTKEEIGWGLKRHPAALHQSEKCFSPCSAVPIVFAGFASKPSSAVFLNGELRRRFLIESSEAPLDELGDVAAAVASSLRPAHDPLVGAGLEAGTACVRFEIGLSTLPALACLVRSFEVAQN